MAILEQYKNAIVANQNTFATITAGQTTSNVFECQSVPPGALLFPSNWTPCNIGFSVSADGQNFGFLADSTGTIISIATNTTQFLPLFPINFHCCSQIQIICSIAQVSTAQVQFILAPYHQGIHA